jgi:hypothetical protein
MIDDDDFWSNLWNKNWQGKPKYSEKTYPSATLSTTKSHMTDPVSNPGPQSSIINLNYRRRNPYYRSAIISDGTVFLVVMRFSPVEFFRSFGRSYFLHLQSRRRRGFFRNVSEVLTGLHSITSQKIVLSIVTADRTSKLLTISFPNGVKWDRWALDKILYETDWRHSSEITLKLVSFPTVSVRCDD